MRKLTFPVLVFALMACALFQAPAQPTLPAPTNTPAASVPLQPTATAAQPVATATSAASLPLRPTATPAEPVATAISASTANAACAASAGAAASATAPARAQGGPRRPRGLYVQIIVGDAVDKLQRTNPAAGPPEIHASLRQMYCGLLDNAVVAGLRLGTPWRLLNPNPPSGPQAYDWSYLDDAFSSVAGWNAAHPTQAAKTLQIGITPGFTTSQWVLDQIPSCDGLFMSPKTPPNDCGKATFLGFAEGGGGVLPLPWNAFYQSAFRMFLTAFAAQYGANPALVSVEISGPTAASTEMILPTDSRTPPQAQFGGITANAMWLKLLAFAYPDKPAYQKSDQAFIDQWNVATELFAELFHGTTLIATTGAGLSNLAPMRNFFAGTPAAAAFGGDPGRAPLNYLQIYSEDFDYAAAHINAPARVVQTDGTRLTLTAQDLLNLASQKLLELAEPPGGS